MTELNTILTQLQVASHAGTLKRYEKKIGETKPYYGVPMGAISGIAKAYKNRLDLFAPLWQTGVLEAQYLAIQIAKNKPDQLPQADLENCLNEEVSVNVLDKLASIIILRKKKTARIGKKSYLPKTRPSLTDLAGSFVPNTLLEKQQQTKKLKKL